MDSLPNEVRNLSFGPFEGRVDADAAIAFALATNDPNPAYAIRVVPPLYSVAFIMPALGAANAACMDLLAISGDGTSVHGEHDVYFHAPLQPESTVRLEVTPHSTHQTPAGLLLTQRILVSDMEGKPLVEHLWSSLYVGGATESLGGPALPDHRFPQVARQRGIGSETIDIALDQSYRYAGVTDDRVPHSLDDEAARREGFPFKILQGMCTMSMCAGAVVRVAGEGDPLALRRLAARFAAPVHPKHQLVVEVFDVESTSEGYRAVAFEARSGGVTCIRHGRAEFAMQKG